MDELLPQGSIQQQLALLAAGQQPAADSLPEFGRQLMKHLAGLAHEDALAMAAEAGKNARPVEHLDYTMEDGLLVFTRWYHLKRGSCCGNGCRHCPY